MVVKRLAAAFAALALAGFAQTATAQETKLNVIVFQGFQNLPFFAAQAKGLFAKRGLSVDVKITPTSDELRGGLAEGRYHIAHAGVDNAIAMAEVAKKDIAVVIGGDGGLNHLFVKRDIASLADLRGKTVIVDAPNTAYAFLLYDMLRMKGLNKGDYEVKVVGATFRRYEAIMSDASVAASILNAPFSIRAEAAGLKDMGSAIKALGPYQATAGFVMRQWAKDNGDVLVRYLQAYIEGLRWSLDPANKAEAVKLLAEGLKLAPDIAERTYAVALDPSEGFAKDGMIDFEGLRNVLALRGRIEGAPPAAPEKYLDLSYYDRALAEQ
jgi:ABC-type nitrate/sulfonate/bicarbonate transport system substrate-binding protein